VFYVPQVDLDSSSDPNGREGPVPDQPAEGVDGEPQEPGGLAERKEPPAGG